MAQENGSRFKLVYQNWVTKNGQDIPLPNGLHKELVLYIKNQLSDIGCSGFDRYRFPEIDHLYGQKEKTGYFFRNSNFLFHFLKNVGEHNLINDDRIADDNSVYLFPLEIESNALELLINEHTINVNGIDYQYKFIECLNDNIISLIKSKKLKLLLVNMVDAGLSNDAITRLGKFLLNFGIKTEDIVVLTGNKRFSNKIQEIDSDISLYQLSNDIEKYPCKTSLQYISDIVRPSDLNLNLIRDKKFLSFNRYVNRYHRLGLLYIFLKLNILKDCYSSFLYIDKTEISKILKNFVQNDKIQIYEEQIKNLIPYELDTEHLTDLEKITFYSVDNNKKEFYVNSYIHITSESEFESNASPFFSEKTWRPIINLQPFIYLGNPYSLKKLHTLGFKTFHPFIDETYDNVEDRNIRFLMIEKEISKLSKMNIEEIHNWYYSIVDILIHNQEQIKKYKNYNVLNNFLSYFPI